MNLDDLRVDIDGIDEKIVSLLNERAICAIKAGELKRASGMEEMCDKERERQVVERVTELSGGPLSDEAVARIYKELMASCLGLEEE